MVKHRRIVLVCLTILWDWCLIGLIAMLFLVLFKFTYSCYSKAEKETRYDVFGERHFAEQ